MLDVFRNFVRMSQYSSIGSFKKESLAYLDCCLSSFRGEPPHSFITPRPSNQPAKWTESVSFEKPGQLTPLFLLGSEKHRAGLQQREKKRDSVSRREWLVSFRI